MRTVAAEEDFVGKKRAKPVLCSTVKFLYRLKTYDIVLLTIGVTLAVGGSS